MRSKGGAAGLPREALDRCGAVAQLGEHLLCKQGVNGSIPFSSTTIKAESRQWRVERVEKSSLRLWR